MKDGRTALQLAHMILWDYPQARAIERTKRGASWSVEFDDTATGQHVRLWSAAEWSQWKRANDIGENGPATA